MNNLESLYSRFAAVTTWNGEIVFAGRYDQCCSYMRKRMWAVKQNLIDLQYAEQLPDGSIKLGKLASYVL